MSFYTERAASQGAEIEAAVAWAAENGIDETWTARLLTSHTRRRNIRNDVQSAVQSDGRERHFYVDPETGKEISTAVTGGSLPRYRHTEATEGVGKATGKALEARRTNKVRRTPVKRVEVRPGVFQIVK